MELLIKLGVFLLLAAIGYWRGGRNERAHVKWLAAEEQRLSDVLVFAGRYPPRMDRTVDPVLVTGEVVVGSDFFRLLLASLRKIVGGNYRSYEKLMDRGRRHALIQLKTQARQKGASMVFNVRYTASGIANTRAGEAAQIQIIAYGTAFVKAQGSVAQSRVHHQPGTHITEHDGATDLMKHPVSRWWVVGWFVGVLYVFVEMLADSHWEHAWRYVGGAPWVLFALLAVVGAAGLAYFGRRRRLGWGIGLTLAVLTAPLLLGVLYFGALRVNAATASNATPTRYELRSDQRLYPLDSASKSPVLWLDGYLDYWATQKEGTQVDVPMVKGWLGFHQYDINSLRDRYRAYYQAR